MSDHDRQRIDRLELTSRELADRLTRLEARCADLPSDCDPAGASLASLTREPAPPAAPALSRPAGGSPQYAIRRVATSPPATDAPACSAPTAFRPSRRSPLPDGGMSLEDLLAGRVLAWGGAVTILVGIVLLFAIAISRGWIGEEARTLLGFAISSALVVAGGWAYERRGRTEASLAAAATGLAGLFVTVVVAARLYELVPAAVGVPLGLLTGTLSTALAVRWRDTGIAALGIVGGLLAPVLVDAPRDGATTALLLTATLPAAAICVRERWDWLGLAACAAVTPQWVGYVFGAASLPALSTLVAFGTVAAVAAVGFELRAPTVALRPAAAALLAFNAFVLAAAGWLALDQHPLWLIALSAVHAVIGAGLLQHPRASRPVGVLASVLGAVLADLALLQLLDGPALTLGWAAATVGFAALVRLARIRGGALEDAAAGAGLAAHVALALLSALMGDAPPERILAGAGAGIAASGALAALAAACLAAGLMLAERTAWRRMLDGTGLAAAAYLAAANLDGVLLVGAWAAEAVALAELSRRRRDAFVLRAGFAHLGLALAHTLTVEAPVFALLGGLERPLAATLAVGACLVAAWRCAGAAAAARVATTADEDLLRHEDAPVADPAAGLHAVAASLGALLALHLASVQLVTAVGPGAQAQALLSVLWGAAGVASLLAGLLRDLAPLRTGALWLLLAALGKVFLYDLSALTPVARVVSFLVLGLLLLLGAFAWQRIRPRPLPDLRDAAAGLRG